MYKLIIVDDESLTRDFLKQIIPTLSDEWEVIGVASDGIEALELLEYQPIDLILTDIKMPLMDGLELCKEIQNKYNSIHCVILSGYGEFEYAKKAIKYNVNNYLLKPIINEELAEMLKSIAEICKKEKKQQNRFNNLIHTSKKYKEEIITKLLKAVIDNNRVEIDSLYTVLCNLDTNFSKAEGNVAIIGITEDILIQSNIELTQLNNLKLLLYKTVKNELNNLNIKVFTDSDDNTVLYIPVEPSHGMEDFIVNIECIYSRINKIFIEKNKVNLFCTTALTKNSILKMGNSYEFAKKTVYQYLFYDELQSKVYVYSQKLYNDKIKTFNSYIKSIIYAIYNNDSIQLELLSKELSNFVFENINKDKRIRCFCLFIDILNNSLDLKEDSLEQLYTMLINSKDNLDNISLLNNLITKITDFYLKYNSKDDFGCELNNLVDQAKQYIYNHYMEAISLSLIADKLSVTPAYLSNLFHQSEGESYIKFLTHVRLKHAENFLKNENIKLNSITEKVGYLSVKHFSAVFKKHYNMSPGEYRKKHRV